MTEEQLQSKCTTWFWNTYPEHRRMLFHVDNNSWNNVIGAKKKALGVCAGVSDLVLILSMGRIVFIETKIPGGKQSNEQLEFEKKLYDRNHLYFIYTSFEEFKNLIENLLCTN